MRTASEFGVWLCSFNKRGFPYSLSVVSTAGHLIDGSLDCIFLTTYTWEKNLGAMEKFQSMDHVNAVDDHAVLGRFPTVKLYKFDWILTHGQSPFMGEFQILQ